MPINNYLAWSGVLRIKIDKGDDDGVFRILSNNLNSARGPYLISYGFGYRFGLGRRNRRAGTSRG